MVFLKSRMQIRSSTARNGYSRPFDNAPTCPRKNCFQNCCKRSSSSVCKRNLQTMFASLEAGSSGSASRWLHVRDDILAKLGTLNLRCAFHQAGEVVGDALAVY